jgi:hypothetical protein
MTIETYIRAQMVRFAIQQGARYGGTSCMIAIAFTLRNRVFAGWGSWLEMVEKAPSHLANREIPEEDIGRVLRSGDGRIMLARIDEIYARPESEDITGGALFWVDPNLPIVEAFKKDVIGRPEEHARIAHIGPLWFFK